MTNLFYLLKIVDNSICLSLSLALVFCSVWPWTANADCAVSFLHGRKVAVQKLVNLHQCSSVESKCDSTPISSTEGKAPQYLQYR